MIRIKRTLNRAVNKALPRYHRNTICVVLPDGYKLRISNKAKEMTAKLRRPVRISELIRAAIVKAFRP